MCPPGTRWYTSFVPHPVVPRVVGVLSSFGLTASTVTSILSAGQLVVNDACARAAFWLSSQ